MTQNSNPDTPQDLSPVKRTPFYFGPDTESLFGWYHAPQTISQRGTGVVICPPIGYEYVHSHRSLRHLADELARRGLPVLRFDYHGSGDSGGLNQDPERLEAWLESIRQAIRALKDMSGCEQVALAGLRMGATLAAMIAAEQDIESLVLWEPCIQGRRFVRELKALHMTASSQPGAADSTAADIESAGFVITAQTAADLGTIRLAELSPRSKRILISQRNDAPHDTSLREAWSSSGMTVEQTIFSGYADMMAETHFTEVPVQAIADIGDWLVRHALPARQPQDKDSEPVLRQHTQMRFRHYLPEVNSAVDETLYIDEHVLQFGSESQLFGIVSQPLSTAWQQRPTIVLLNSGSVHHIGPHRLYVFLTRQFAQLGFRCLRLDLSGIGDSIIADVSLENHPYTRTATHDTADAIVALKQTQPDAGFVLMGLCSGAYASFHAALDIIGESIDECILMNPLTFYWKEGMTLAIPSEAHYRQWSDYRQSMRKLDKWLKLLRGKVSIREIAQTIFDRLRILVRLQLKSLKKLFKSRPSQQDERGDLGEDLGKVASLGRQISFIFSEHDPGHDLLMTNARPMVKKLVHGGQMTIQTISHADHTFSKNAARQVVISRLTDLLTQRYRNTGDPDQPV